MISTYFHQILINARYNYSSANMNSWLDLTQSTHQSKRLSVENSLAALAARFWQSARWNCQARKRNGPQSPDTFHIVHWYKLCKHTQVPTYIYIYILCSETKSWHTSKSLNISNIEQTWIYKDQKREWNINVCIFFLLHIFTTKKIYSWI